MIKEFTRIQRIEQELQRRIMVIIQQKINDPRIEMVSVLSVKISRDLAYAKVFVSFCNINDDDYNQYIINSIKIMNGYMANYIRFLLGKSMVLRVIPQLTFIYDHSLIEGNYVTDLIKIAINEKGL